MDRINAQELALFAVVLNSTKKTIKKKRPEYLERHKEVTSKVLEILHSIKSEDQQEIEFFDLGTENNEYAVQLINSYLDQQRDPKKAKKERAYAALDGFRKKLNSLVQGV